VRNAIQYLNSGEIVYSNFKIHWYGYEGKKFNWRRLRFEKVSFPKSNLRYWKRLDDLYRVDNGIILMDEAHVYMNSRRWKDLPEDMEKKLAQHRKDGLHIEGTVQSVNRLDTIIRELIDYWYVYENTFFFFVRWEFSIDDDKQKKYPLSKRYFRKRKKIYELYDTLEKIATSF